MYSDAIEFLYSLRWFGAKFGLTNSFKLAEMAGNPQNALRFIHVAGTNGKGSTCAILESVYRAAGLRVGLFTSPHLVAFAERIQVNRQPDANIVDTVARIKALMPQFRAQLPPSVRFQIVSDRTLMTQESMRDAQRTVVISIGLVIFVVFIFLRNARSTFIPIVSVPVSIIATFGAMYLLGYTLDNLSLMALTIATGFVVDDAIVVIENITRYLEAGMKPMQAALKGAAEIGFTVLSMSVSLIAVFIPILMMSGTVGRLFREFAVVLSVSIVVSMVISLTIIPMMSAWLLK